MEESKILNEDNTKVPPSEFHFSLDSIVNEFEHFKHDFLEFVSLIDWTETWIISLITFYIFFFTFIVFTRKNSDLQSVIFFILLFMIYMGETINNWCRNNWESFSSKPYFDSNGAFLTLIYSLPLLICVLFILINLIAEMSKLLIRVKRDEIRRKKAKHA